MAEEIDSSNAIAMQTAIKSVEALGKGFDVNLDTRLLYCKAGSRLVEVDESHTKDLYLYDAIVLPNVSVDIKNSVSSFGRWSSGVCPFHEMVKLFNRKANVSGDFPLGSFISEFGFTGLKNVDLLCMKSVSMDGFYIPLAKVQLVKSPLSLLESVIKAVPACWDPLSLACFIEKFGTHVITSVTIGGKDVIYVKQHQSSSLSTMEVKNYIENVGNHRFHDKECPSYPSPVKFKAADSGIFYGQEVYPQPAGALYLCDKEDIVVIFRRRGGDDSEQSHTNWARTVRLSPDVIDMAFVPIVDLLAGAPGKEHLARAIGLYLEYKPQVEELRYFFEFQTPKIWTPPPIQPNIVPCDRKEPICPSLQFSMMGPKLFVCRDQVSVGRKPVTGVRLSLEGSKKNRLRIHLQYLASLPKVFLPHWDAHAAIGASRWKGPEEQDSRWFEPVKWKNFSHVSTAPIENLETVVTEGDVGPGVFIVTGAQLGVWDFGSRNVLHMKFLYSMLPRLAIRRSVWDPTWNEDSECPPVAAVSKFGSKLSQLVDVSEMCRGPEDPPGHWLVTGGKLCVVKGKIFLRVKYSLLNY